MTFDRGGVAGRDYAAEMRGIEDKTEHKIPRLVRKADDNPVLVLDVDDTTLQPTTTR